MSIVFGTHGVRKLYVKSIVFNNCSSKIPKMSGFLNTVATMMRNFLRVFYLSKNLLILQTVKRNDFIITISSSDINDENLNMYFFINANLIHGSEIRPVRKKEK